MLALRLIFTIFLLITSSFSHAAEHTTLAIMTFNIENGGTQVSFQHVVDAIKLSQADVAGIQEAWGNTKRIAQALDWKYYDARLHIVSKYPLYIDAHNNNYDLIEVSSNHFAAITNLHLPDEPYGPDLINRGKSPSQVMANENKTRLSFAAPFIASMQALAKQNIPVFITGDFNSPSHLDWTQATVNKVRNHRYAMSWPVTKMLQDYGFTDSFRAVYHDPLKVLGITWPSRRPRLPHAIDNYNPSANDLPDRLDFIFTCGPSYVTKSRVIENPTPWPSDHRAVVSTFSITPAELSKHSLKPVTPTTGTATIKTVKSNYHTYEPILINWTHSPANGYDYIRIIPTDSEQTALENASRFYTHAQPDGMLEISARNIQGNWVSWSNNPTAHWPLPAGNYKIQLMLDDGNHIVASTNIQINNNKS